MRNEKGVALLTSLIFLVVLTILGLSAMRSTTMQERMSGNLRDQSIATQAAEAALRDARSDLTYGAHGNTRSITASSFPLPSDDACVAGLCGTNGVSNFLAETSEFWTNANSAQWAAYGQFTAAGSISGLSTQPRYIMELLPTTLNAKLSLSSLTNTAFYVRITAQGYGLSPDTVVRLEEVVLVELDS